MVLVACGGSAGSSDTDTSSGATEATSAATTSAATGPTSAGPESTSEPEATSTGSTSEATTAGPTTSDESSTGTTGAVEPPTSLEEIVDGELELIADGHVFTEGPVWSPEGYLLYSDIPADTIFRWTEATGAEALIMPSGHSNGLTFDGMGRLLAAEHGNRRLSRQQIGVSPPETVVDAYMGQKLNSPNDVVWRSDGTLYFTDPPYGIQPAQQELPFQGVFRVDPQGDIHLVADDFNRPNGVALAPDGATLYVDDTAEEHVRSFAVMADGSTLGGEIFVDLKSDLPGDPDGMAIDEFGDLYVTGGGGVRVVTPAGEVLGTISVPESATNCEFGGDDGRTLFITAPPRVYRIRLKVAGA